MLDLNIFVLFESFPPIIRLYFVEILYHLLRC